MYTPRIELGTRPIPPLRHNRLSAHVRGWGGDITGQQYYDEGGGNITGQQYNDENHQGYEESI